MAATMGGIIINGRFGEPSGRVTHVPRNNGKGTVTDYIIADAQLFHGIEEACVDVGSIGGDGVGCMWSTVSDHYPISISAPWLRRESTKILERVYEDLDILDSRLRLISDIDDWRIDEYAEDWRIKWDSEPDQQIQYTAS